MTIDKLLLIGKGAFRASVWLQKFLRVVGMGKALLLLSGGGEPWLNERRTR